jgi:hypothetical protein
LRVRSRSQSRSRTFTFFDGAVFWLAVCAPEEYLAA